MDLKTNRLLRESPLLDGLDEDLLNQITTSGRVREYRGRLGRIDADELCQRLHFVVSGEMHMISMTPDGQECLIQRFAPGEFFCLTSVFTGICCNSQIVSAGTSRILSWPQEQFRQLLLHNPDFYRNLLKQMAKQVEQERNLRTLSRCSRADLKLVAYLLYKLNFGRCKAHQKELTVDLRPISLTAQELGIARETLSRCLQKLVCKEGISYQKGQVTVTDIKLLEQVLAEEECGCHSRRAIQT